MPMGLLLEELVRRLRRYLRRLHLGRAHDLRRRRRRRLRRHLGRPRPARHLRRRRRRHLRRPRDLRRRRRRRHLRRRLRRQLGRRDLRRRVGVVRLDLGRHLRGMRDLGRLLVDLGRLLVGLRRHLGRLDLRRLLGRLVLRPARGGPGEQGGGARHGHGPPHEGRSLWQRRRSRHFSHRLPSITGVRRSHRSAGGYQRSRAALHQKETALGAFPAKNRRPRRRRRRASRRKRGSRPRSPRRSPCGSRAGGGSTPGNRRPRGASRAGPRKGD